ncbi:MAG: TM2 domain-containing protein [Prevotella sp.]|nr:TM2 domain-containing protein [Prevotella sp.]MDD7272440.1 TM2 domain-containing protein [Prevotellaceae bacterium]MDY3935198.1 TM2 domain-containing protein [Prevotella sp.]MDY4218754.1 TM2 domain-containing protein [Prevotella sp.]
MTEKEVDQLLLAYGNRLPSGSIFAVRDYLLGTDYSLAVVRMSQLKDPTIALLLSIFLGYLGIDRFYLGHTGLGVAKLLTCGGFYIWHLIDIFLIMDATKERNFQLLTGQIF